MSSVTPEDVATEIVSSQYHPSYSDEDANLILTSSDGVMFRVHPVILQMASMIFRYMLFEAQDTGEPVRLEEKSDVLKGLLDCIYPTGPSLRLSSQKFEFIWSLLIAADKYEIRKIKDEFRNRLNDDRYFLEHPLESYAIACRFSWMEEISTISTLCLDITKSEQSWAIFSLLENMHLLRLLKLVWTREKMFTEAWIGLEMRRSDDAGFFNFLQIRHTLLLFVKQEILNFPSGKTFEKDFWLRLEVKELLASFKDHNLPYDAMAILRTLPSSVDDIHIP